LYFIFTKITNYDPKVDFFIHQPTLSWNEVHHSLQKDRVWAHEVPSHELFQNMLTCEVSTGIRANAKSATMQPHTSPTGVVQRGWVHFGLMATGH
jgi:hypothetical protein